LVDWLGVTVTTVVLAAAPFLLVCASAFCDVWPSIPAIIAADAITTIIVAAAIILECFIIAGLLVFLLLHNFLIRTLLPSYDYKDGHNFQLWLLLNFYLRRRMIARMGSVKGTIIGGMFSPTSADGGSLKYYCMSCWMQHNLQVLCVARN
jgi:hypothetical protein